MTEVLNADGYPTRIQMVDLQLMMMIMIFGLVLSKNISLWIVDTQLPLGFPIGGYPGPQGMYYCSVGGKNTHGRDLSRGTC